MTIRLVQRSDYAVGLGGLVLAMALAPLCAAFASGCADDAAVQEVPSSNADAGAPVDPCQNSRKDDEETDTDCGGVCGKCVDGKMCEADADCVNGACLSGFCRAPACDDGRMNGTETDVDCGGTCGKCDVKMACVLASDCSTGLCGENKKCLPTTCGDAQKNGNESDVDCGGMCAPCAASKACRAGYDCSSGVCDASGKCLAPACNDTVFNGDETDLDCGGSCSTKCSENKKCYLNEHCESSICSAPQWGDTTKRCRAPGCFNFAKDSGETDLDCGGPCDSKCQDGLGCLADVDCISGVCDEAAGKCQSPTCSDGVLNGSESDLDCGSSCPCEPGRRCTWDGECNSGVCDEEIQKCLAPTCSDTVQNGDETDADCGGTCAAKCNEGQHCALDGDCATAHCMDGHCMAPP